jgi:hypothetical protein
MGSTRSFPVGTIFSFKENVYFDLSRVSYRTYNQYGKYALCQ